VLYILFYSSAAKLYYHYFPPVYALSAVLVALVVWHFYKEQLFKKIIVSFVILWIVVAIGVTVANIQIHHIRSPEVYNLTDKMTTYLDTQTNRQGIMVRPGEPDWDVIAKTSWYWRSDILTVDSINIAIELLKNEKKFTYLLIPAKIKREIEFGDKTLLHQYAANDQLIVYTLSR
jgi:hypothetical protein